MITIAVTGSTGSKGRGLGPVVVNTLRGAGYRVLTLDLREPEVFDPEFRPVDLTDYGAALRADFTGAEAMGIFAADTTWNEPNEALVARFYPGATLKPGTGPYETLVSNDKAKRLIGYEPRHSWRDVLSRADP